MGTVKVVYYNDCGLITLCFSELSDSFILYGI